MAFRQLLRTHSSGGTSRSVVGASLQQTSLRCLCAVVLLLERIASSLGLTVDSAAGPAGAQQELKQEPSRSTATTSFLRHRRSSAPK
mmetsp:Transcript_17129/g.38928  ORF Transcript_17129/g.38928 Transcript_17129/m.38928 type:complete len:87 (+) Transcript_17129:29-289(+)